MSGSWGPRLRQERQKTGLNQEAFGKIGGVSRKSQSEYETGAVAPNLEYLDRLSESGVDIAFVLTGVPSAGEVSASEARLLNSFRSLDQDWQAMLLKMATKLADERAGAITHETKDRS